MTPLAAEPTVTPHTSDDQRVWGRVTAIFGKYPVPDNFERLAVEYLEQPCPCNMCLGKAAFRNVKQANNVRSDLRKNRFKRAVVMWRDRARCVQCGTTDDLTVDHIVGPAKGGSNSYHNLQVLCAPCHSLKPDSHNPQFLVRHLANRVAEVWPQIGWDNDEERERAMKVRRLVDNILDTEVPV